MVEESMWGAAPQSGKGIKLPSEYLDEQATILTKMYGYKLRGDVTQSVLSTGRITIDFDIIVPSLSSYRYSLLKVMHDLEIYPLTLYGLANKTDYKCHNEEEFKDSLKEVLSSGQVRTVIENILTLIKK